MSHLLAPIVAGQPLLVPDPRTRKWPLSGDFTLLSVLLVSYVYVVKVAGPRFMKGRQPYHGLKPVIVMYNAIMVLLNVFFVYQFSKRSYFGGPFSWLCQGISYDESRNNMEIIALIWWYVMVRIADFLDTIFFVLRKKDSHVSFLHVVHHVLVVFNGWFGVTFGSDGHGLFTVIMNSFVHVVMYSYYFISLLGPGMRKYLWWKKYLTALQIGQFVAMFFHSLVPVFVDCGYPLSHVLIQVPQVCFFFVMFVRFYVQAYRRGSGKAAVHETDRRKAKEA